MEWALSSVRPWVDEILVVDMDSDDDTRDIAHRFRARIVSHPPVGFVEPGRVFGMARVGHPWVIMLDADEVVPAPLSRKLKAIAQADAADVVQIPMINYSLGGACRGGPLSPSRDAHIRFFKRGAVELGTTPHARPAVVRGARLLRLPVRPDECLEHFAHRDFNDLLVRANRYTDIQAESDAATGHVETVPRVAFRAARQFLGGYVKHRGYRDGWRGFHTSAFFAYYELVRHAKASQLLTVGDAASTRAAYEARARAVVEQYSQTDPQRP